MLDRTTLETERLLLRLLTHADIKSIQDAASDRRVADTTISIPHPYPGGEAQRYVFKKIADFESGESVSFAIESKAEKAFCGVIEIRDIDREHLQGELSFWLAVQAWGKGYMSEALQPIIRFGFEDLELNRLYAYHMVRNPASGRVLQKNGLLPEGLLRQRVRRWGVFEDVKLWAILRTDWQSKAE
ncbi:MAG: GNAT family N-acetyltransferase [Cyanosarcina radialis HA8281-LM2]|jgi:RimJ/RimL family protein N-acetyltransferase|nr:GNAT family N-acetyltransferase [Cyanosarcina radialis HA8281-LM2]